MKKKFLGKSIFFLISRCWCMILMRLNTYGTFAEVILRAVWHICIFFFNAQKSTLLKKVCNHRFWIALHVTKLVSKFGKIKIKIRRYLQLFVELPDTLFWRVFKNYFWVCSTPPFSHCINAMRLILWGYAVLMTTTHSQNITAKISFCLWDMTCWSLVQI